MFLIGIDDTDNLESRGTGYRARQLGGVLADAGIPVIGITRHQLLVDPRIPYTSHNSSACLEATCSAERANDVIKLCEDFLLRESAPGSDAGLCVARREQATHDVVMFGRRAKLDVLVASEAEALARACAIHLEGLTGTRIGVIGALAGVGLRAGGDDGRYLWLPGLRDLSGVVGAAALEAQLGVSGIETENGRAVDPADRIDVGDWPRPLLRGGRTVLLVEAAQSHECDWRVIPRARIKELSGGPCDDV
jgi:hypothetical protein